MDRIALLDDDGLWCHAVQRFFRNSFEVSIFNDATSLLKVIEKEAQYELIMIDLSLPPSQYIEIDGRKLIRQIRKMLPNPPILVLVTGFISKNDLANGEVICPEADAFLGKDGGLDEILKQIQQLIILQKNGDDKYLRFNHRSRW
jgi:CheY-like chemotaxis protein